MSLNRNQRCPLGKDLAPGCPSCQKCKFFVAKESNTCGDYGEDLVECRIDNARSEIEFQVGAHQIADSLYDLSEIIINIVKEKILEKEEG